MPLNFYKAYIDGLSKEPVEDWQESYQAASDDAWDNTSTVRTIQSQRQIGSKIYDAESVQVTSILNPKTGTEIGDDWREIVHKTYIDDNNFVGKYYIFDEKTWITTNTNKREGSVRTSIIRRCNQILRWADDNGDVKEWMCAFSNNLSGTQPETGSFGVPEIRADAVVCVQQNDDTRKIRYNQRFLFDGKPYVVVQTNPHIIESYLLLYVNASQVQPVDNTDNDIASDTDNIIENGIQILPDTSKMLYNQSETYDVHFIENGGRTSHAFSFDVIGGLEGSYEFTVTGDNSFFIKNRARSPIPVVVLCADRENGATKKLSLTFGGEY